MRHIEANKVAIQIYNWHVKKKAFNIHKELNVYYILDILSH